MKYNNIVLTIVPEDIEGNYGTHSYDEVIRASWCYLHGELEIMNEFDIFSLVKSEILPEHQSTRWISDTFPSGAYEAICFDQPCTFFIWNHSRHNSGLVVLNSDTISYQDAKNKFETKSQVI